MTAEPSPSTALQTTIPWHARLVLLSPNTVAQGLARIASVFGAERCPNLWQVELGVMRMWWRLLFRSETVGTCSDHPPRANLRSRVLNWRVFRGPFLLWERAIAPWDMSGLLSSPERIVRHLLGAHHDRAQFGYDFELLRMHPGWLDTLEARAAAVVTGADPRADWLRDLTVYEQYHENLLRSIRAFRKGDPIYTPEEAADPDISFQAWLDWCSAQPATPAQWWAALRSGRYDFTQGVRMPTP